MSIKIGSNIPSLMAQRRLSESALSLGKTYERLSSGQRINSASDDAAGLAISESLRSDARLFQQSVRNINDGISMLNIAEGAVRELSGIITRITELAEQSANGVYSSKQRAALDNEAQALSEEYLRIQSTTTFNGIKLLTADSSSFSLQVGIDSSQNSILEVSLAGDPSRLVADGTFASVAAGTIGSAFDNMQVADFTGDGIADLVGTRNSGPQGLWISVGNNDGTFSAQTQIDNTNAGTRIRIFDFNGDGDLDLYSRNNNSVRINNGDGTFQNEVTNSLGDDMEFGYINGDSTLDAIGFVGSTVTFYSGNGNGTFAAGVDINTGGGSLSGLSIADFDGDGELDFARGSVSGDDFRVFLGNGDGTFSSDSVDYGVNGNIDSINAGDVNGDGNVDLITKTGAEIELFIGNSDGTFQSSVSLYGISSEVSVSDINNDGLSDLAIIDGSNNFYSILSNGDGTFATPAIIGSANKFTFGDVNSDGVSDMLSLLGTNLTSFIANVTVSNIAAEDGLAEFSLLTAQDARSTLTAMNEAMVRMSSVTGTIGSYQSRLLVAMNNNSVAANSYKEAESRIRDVDIAEESSRLTRLTILQQAATAVLAQANQQPSLAVSLLN